MHRGWLVDPLENTTTIYLHAGLLLQEERDGDGGEGGGARGGAVVPRLPPRLPLATSTGTDLICYC